MNKNCKTYIITFFLLFIFLSQNSYSQHINEKKDSTFWIFNRKPLVTYSVIAYSAVTLYLEYKWWWEDNFHKFNYRWEGFLNDYSLGVDKIGHFYTSYLYFSAAKEIMQWANFDESTVLLAAIGIPLAHAISVEIGDGFSSYAFSPDDLIANSLGIGYGYLQYKVPFFQNFNIKWSYFPSPGTNIFASDYRLTDDYDGHIYWLSFNMHNLLPEPIDAYWPKFLNLAIGYGVKNYSPFSSNYDSSQPVKRHFAISLDYNLTEIPLEGGFIDLLKGVLNYFHFPAPGIEKTEGENLQFKPLLTN